MALLIVQIIVLAMFLMAAAMKSFTPKAEFEKKMPWAKELSQEKLRMIGAFEVLGALGVTLPIWLDVLPWVTPVAGILLIVLVLNATMLHMRRKETGNVIFTLVNVALIGYIVWQTWSHLGL